MSVKTSVSIPDEIFNKARKLSDNFSSVATAVVRRHRIATKHKEHKRY